jgi:hypothetical protein
MGLMINTGIFGFDQASCQLAHCTDWQLPPAN